MRTVLYFIIAFICICWPIISLFNGRKHKLFRAQKVFMLTNISVGLEFCVLACLSIPSCEGALWTEAAAAILAPLGAFLYYVFLRMATSVEGMRAKDWLMLIPVVVFWVLDLGLNVILGPEQTTQYILHTLNSQEIDIPSGTLLSFRCTWGYWIGHIALLAAYVTVLFYGNTRFKVYHAQLENYYSSLRGLADTMDIYIRTFTWVAVVVISLTFLSPNLESGAFTPITLILSFFGAGLFYFIGHYVYGLEYNMNDLVSTAKEPEKPAQESTESSEKPQAEEHETPSANTSYSKFSKALKQALEEEVYLEQGIELVSLADRIGTNRTYLSNIIHDEYGQSFAEFINSRRIAYAIKLMESSDEQYPIRYVAMKCGYSSLQTFYNNFAKFTDGKTPASYLKH